MKVYRIVFHYRHYKPFISHFIDTTEDFLDFHLSILSLNKDIIVDNIIKNYN